MKTRGTNTVISDCLEEKSSNRRDHLIGRTFSDNTSANNNGLLEDIICRDSEGTDRRSTDARRHDMSGESHRESLSVSYCEESFAEESKGPNVMNDVLLSTFEDKFEKDLIHREVTDLTDDILALDTGSEVSITTTEDDIDSCYFNDCSGANLGSLGFKSPKCNDDTTRQIEKDDSLIRNCVEKEMGKFSDEVFIGYNNSLESPSEHNSSLDFIDETLIATNALVSCLGSNSDDIAEEFQCKTPTVFGPNRLFLNPDYQNSEREIEAKTERSHCKTDDKVHGEADEKRRKLNRMHARNSRERLKANRLEMEQINSRLQREHHSLTNDVSKRRQYYIELKAWLLGHSPCVQQSKEWKKKERKKNKLGKFADDETKSSQDLRKFSSPTLQTVGIVNKCPEVGTKQKKKEDKDKDNQSKKLKTNQEEKYCALLTYNDVKGQNKEDYDMSIQKKDDVKNVKSLPLSKTAPPKSSVYNAKKSSVGTPSIDDNIIKQSCCTRNSIRSMKSRQTFNFGNSFPSLAFHYYSQKDMTLVGRKINTKSHAISTSKSKPKISTLEFKIPLPRPLIH